MELIGKVARSPQEEVRITLHEERGRPCLTLQTYGSPGPGATPTQPGRELLLLPVDQLPQLIRVLVQAQELCRRRSLLYVPAPAARRVEGAAAPPPLAGRGIETRREPRVPLRLPVECRLLDPDQFWPGKPIAGELRDVSRGGVQVWLPQRLPRFKQVDVSFFLDQQGFQGRAEIVSVGLEAARDLQTGFHRHGFRWVAVEPRARDILAAAIAKRSGRSGR